MEIVKKIGVWMDHSSASIMAFTAGDMETESIDSAFSHEEKEESFSKSENLMHNKEQHLQAAYYAAIAKAIDGYGEVLLFGPTDAKSELFNILKADSHFAKTKIDVEQTDKMTGNQQHAFVKEHFSKK